MTWLATWEPVGAQALESAAVWVAAWAADLRWMEWTDWPGRAAPCRWRFPAPRDTCPPVRPDRSWGRSQASRRPHRPCPRLRGPWAGGPSHHLAQARSTTSRLERAPDTCIACWTRSSSMSILVIITHCTRLVQCGRRGGALLGQRDSCELALAYLHHVGSGFELQPLVADRRGIDAHPAAVDEAAGLACRGRKAGLLQQLADSEGSARQLPAQSRPERRPCSG